MSNDRLYLDIHAIQTVPPSCINRDDAGRPKTAIYGGANRARVSSQAWKRAIRCMFKDELSDGNPGIRTTHVVSLIEKELVKRGFSEEEAQPEAVEALTTTFEIVPEISEVVNLIYFTCAELVP